MHKSKQNSVFDVLRWGAASNLVEQKNRLIVRAKTRLEKEDAR